MRLRGYYQSYSMDPADELYDAVDWPWEERKKIDEEKQQLKMERQSLVRDLN